jgi:hypothetical protein
MLTRILAILAVVCVALILYFTIWFAKDSYEVIPIPIDRMLAQDEWPLFYSDRDKFEVSLPAHPKYTSERVEGVDESQKHEYGVYEVIRPDKSLYLITVITYFNEKALEHPEWLMRSIIDQIVATDKNNHLMSEKLDDTSVKPITDFFIENGVLRCAYRVMIDGSTIYLLGYIAPVGVFNEPDYFHFRDSFKLAETPVVQKNK